MARLSVSYQNILRLKYEEQLCYDDIATKLGIKGHVENCTEPVVLEEVVRDHELFAVA